MATLVRYDELTIQCQCAMQLAKLRPGPYGGRYVGRQFNQASQETIFLTLDHDDPTMIPPNVDVLAQALPDRIVPMGSARNWLRADGTTSFDGAGIKLQDQSVCVYTVPSNNSLGHFSHFEIRQRQPSLQWLLVGRHSNAAEIEYTELATASRQEMVDKLLLLLNGQASTQVSDDLRKAVINTITPAGRVHFFNNYHCEVRENARIIARPGEVDPENPGYWVECWAFVPTVAVSLPVTPTSAPPEA